MISTEESPDRTDQYSFKTLEIWIENPQCHLAVLYNALGYRNEHRTTRRRPRCRHICYWKQNNEVCGHFRRTWLNYNSNDEIRSYSGQTVAQILRYNISVVASNYTAPNVVIRDGGAAERPMKILQPLSVIYDIPVPAAGWRADRYWTVRPTIGRDNESRDRRWNVARSRWCCCITEPGSVHSSITNSTADPSKCLSSPFLTVRW